MSHHNHFFFFRTLWGSLYHAEWKEATARWGLFGLIIEFFRAISGFSAWPFFIPVNSGWEPATIRPILNGYGIANWGWGKHSGEYFFQVRLRQASWAQYLLQQQGVPLSGQLLDESGRSAYRPVTRRSLRPSPHSTPHAAPSPDPSTASFAKPAAKPKATASLFGDPVEQINRAVDRLTKL